MSAVEVRVPGKINLLLAVGPRRDDGYHPVASVYQSVDVYDHIGATARQDAGFALAYDPAGLVLPVDENDLVLRAAHLLRDHATPWRTPETPDLLGADLRVTKHIPIAGGMAGGSADAAGALVALVRTWALEVPFTELVALGARLGVDVPFAIQGGTCLASGAGEILQPMPASLHLHWVLAADATGLSTPDIYRRFDELNPAAEPVDGRLAAPLLAELQTGTPAGASRLLRNDLQSAAVAARPGLVPLMDSAVAAGALTAFVSGSGPTVAALVPDAAAGKRIAVAMQKAYPGLQVLTAQGPVEGPQQG